MVTSSSARLMGVLHAFFRLEGCAMVATSSNTRALGVVREGPSVVLLSVGVPGTSNVRMYRQVHSGMSYPVLFLATETSRRSHIGNLVSNNSSCVLGPFDLGRLRTQVVTRLGERRHHRGGSACHFRNSLSVSCSTGAIRVDKRSVRLAGLRCDVVRFLSVGPKAICSGRQVCRGIYKCSKRKSDQMIARLVQHVQGGVRGCASARCVRAI